MDTIITRKDSVESVQGAESTFTGHVEVALNIPKREYSNMTGGLVTFQPRARTNWHTHPRGQLIILTEGKGRAQEWGGPVQDISAGDIVWFPAGVKHWHGAAPDQTMAHYAISEEQDGSCVTWLEAVSDIDYTAR